VRTHTPPHAHT